MAMALIRNRPLLALCLTAGTLAFISARVALEMLGSVLLGDGATDWVSFYAAGSMIRTGDGGQLFDREAQRAVQAALFGFADIEEVNAYPLPAFFAMAIAPLTMLSFRASYLVFLAANVATLGFLLWTANRHLADVPKETRLTAVVCAAASAPVAMVLFHGQLDLMVLAAVAGCYAMLLRGRPYEAGALLALALMKPHVAGPIVLMLVVMRQWRALAGCAAVGVPLLVVPALLLGPHTLIDQLSLVASYPGSSTGGQVWAELMVNVRGAVVGIAPSSNTWLWAIPLGLVAVACMFIAIRTWAGRSAIDAQSWALAMTLTLIWSPHAHFRTVVFLIAAGMLYILAGSETGRHVRPIRIGIVHVLFAVLWLLSPSGIALAFLPVLALFGLFAFAWPARAAAIAQEVPHEQTAFPLPRLREAGTAQ